MACNPAGVRTSAIYEHIQGGEDEDDVAEQFALESDEINWAISYETSRRAAAVKAA